MVILQVLGGEIHGYEIRRLFGIAISPLRPVFCDSQMSHSLNLLKGGLYRGLYRGTTIGVIKGDTRSLP